MTDNELLIQNACKIIYHNEHLSKNAKFRKISASQNIFNSLSHGPPPQNTAISISLQNAMPKFRSVIFQHIDNSDKNEKKCCGQYTQCH